VYGDLVYVARDAPDRVIRYWQAGDFQPQRLRRGWVSNRGLGKILLKSREDYQALRRTGVGGLGSQAAPTKAS